MSAFGERVIKQPAFFFILPCHGFFFSPHPAKNITRGDHFQSSCSNSTVWLFLIGEFPDSKTAIKPEKRIGTSSEIIFCKTSTTIIIQFFTQLLIFLENKANTTTIREENILPPPSSAERSRHNTWSNSLRCCPGITGGKFGMFHLLGESL